MGTPWHRSAAPCLLSLHPAPQLLELNLGAWWTHRRRPDRCSASAWLFTAPDYTPALRSQHSSSVVAMAAACHRSLAGQTLAAGRGRSCRSSRPWTLVSGPRRPRRVGQGRGSCCAPAPVCLREGCFLCQLLGGARRSWADGGLWAAVWKEDLQGPGLQGCLCTCWFGRTVARSWG